MAFKSNPIDICSSKANKIDQNISLEYINLVFLGKNDIKRHPCINEILNIYNNE